MDDEAYQEMKAQVTESLRLTFRPEFLNRVDEVIVFHQLTEQELASIVDLQIADLARRLASQDLTLEVTPAAKGLIVREGYDPAFGARPLRRTIQRLLENPFAKALLEGRFKPGDRIEAEADIVGGTLVFSTARETIVAEASDRRDARSAAGKEPVAAAGRRRAKSLDLPPIEEPPGDGSERLN
jgi:ATP-dependent Clp protease ATP-binding subunit ClpC